MKNKINLLFSIFYVVIIVPILLPLTIFSNDPWWWGQLKNFCPDGCCCPLEIYPYFYFIVIPLISVVFSLILKTEKFIVIPTFMSLLVFFFNMAGHIHYGISHGHSFLCKFIEGVIFSIIGSIPTFIGSIIGINIRKLISKFKNKYFS